MQNTCQCKLIYWRKQGIGKKQRGALLWQPFILCLFSSGVWQKVNRLSVVEGLNMRILAQFLYIKMSVNACQQSKLIHSIIRTFKQTTALLNRVLILKQESVYCSLNKMRKIIPKYFTAYTRSGSKHLTVHSLKLLGFHPQVSKSGHFFLLSLNS